MGGEVDIVAGADGADGEPACKVGFLLDLFPRLFVELLCAVLSPGPRGSGPQGGLSTVTELEGRLEMERLRSMVETWSRRPFCTLCFFVSTASQMCFYMSRVFEGCRNGLCSSCD